MYVRERSKLKEMQTEYIRQSNSLLNVKETLWNRGNQNGLRKNPGHKGAQIEPVLQGEKQGTQRGKCKRALREPN